MRIRKKGLTLFDWLVKVLIGNAEDYNLEHRFFIASCFVGGMAGLLASIINISLLFHPYLILTTTGIAIVYFIFYFLSLKKKIYKGLILPYIFISLLTISFIWFINAGSGGPVSYVLVTALLVYIVLTRGANRVTAIAVVAITITVLYVWEFLHPELVVNYSDAKSKFIDIYFTALFSIGLISFIASFIMKNYHDEKEMVLKQRDHIIEQNNAIKAAQKELLLYQENLEDLVKQRTQELEETNNQLFIAKEKAEESDRLKTAFLSNMSHEIRTPMNAIIGFSQLLKEPDITNETLNSYIEIITSKGNSLLKIINDIIDISKVEAGEIEISKSACNVNDLMDDLITTFKRTIASAQKKQIELKVNKTRNDEKLVIYTDPLRLNQVLSNLLDNAIKFTLKGYVETGYSIVTDEKGEKIRFYVKDSGIGISSENKEMIFARFRQIDESHTREYGGTGLGLSISKKLVELIGGTLEVQSKSGQGSTFFFSIPFEQVEQNDSSSFQQPHDDIKYDWKDKTILIVEDNYSSYILLQKYLLDTEATILHITNGRDAVELCKTNPDIDLVLMDIQLPIMNGYEATGLIKKHRINLPVIVESAHVFTEDLIRSKKAGCDEYVTKPIEKANLLMLLSKYLD